ncbi:M23 family metallopeptidase [Desulfofundulus thermosubterraneus]|uniref:Peptidase family M23 n=1 Tax=Desulfofundulus thermosubterraneus DSM 16057 TaxID=1121432 RepID=A0A1M6FIZ3_9FIRM|nr:M23 family metallopeptidase [Desulfofundulus thermosubterraneus]SHI97645.1 Peptidase family M23 [Desulfofundulus thermosubterraneus DSM 16057]
MLWNRRKRKYPISEYPRTEDWPYRYSPSRGSRGNSWFWRGMVAMIIFAILLLVRELPYPGGEQVREGLRYLLTTEWNYQPAVQKVVQLALQMVNVDQPFPEDIPPGTRQTLGPAGEDGRFQIPVSGKVVRGFGWVRDPLDDLERFHAGIDIAVPAGTPVKAARDGRVARVGEDPSLGRFVLLDHGEGDYTLYAGLTGIAVTSGQQVAAGQKLAEVGDKGDVAGGGLHFEVREKGRLIDPLMKLQF